jgi:hypothetical protein
MEAAEGAGGFLVTDKNGFSRLLNLVFLCGFCVLPVQIFFEAGSGLATVH